MITSADLGSSSSYSNELLVSNSFIVGLDSVALKAVVEKVSLRVALMQRSVGPKCQEKSNQKSFIIPAPAGVKSGNARHVR
jgi:hypothetical protein